MKQLAIRRAFLLLSICASTTQADLYRLQGDISYATSDENSVELDSSAVRLTWWLEAIDPAGQPLAEAGFLSRASSINLTANRNLAERPGVTFDRSRRASFVQLKDRATQAEASVRYVLANKRWFGELGVRHAETNSQVFGAADLRGEGYRTALGYYLTPTTALRLFANMEDLSDSNTQRQDCGDSLFPCWEALREHRNTETQGYGIGIKHVGLLFARHYAINASYSRTEAEFESKVSLTFPPGNRFGLGLAPNPIVIRSSFDGEPVNTAALALDWYHTNRLSIGANLRYTDTEVPAGEDSTFAYGIRTKWFLTRTIAVALEAVRQEASFRQLDDVDTFRVSFTARL